MRSHRFVLFSVVLSLLISLPASSAEETLGQKILSGALSSAGSKGGEFAVKFVSGWIYNISCKPEQQTDEGSKALCSALGGLSGNHVGPLRRQPRLRHRPHLARIRAHPPDH
jgi:hypothetical protein